MRVGENQYYLSVINKSGQIQEYSLSTVSGNVVKIGRDALSNQVSLQYPFVSARHGEILFEGNKSYYRDRDSTHGTIVESDGRYTFLHHVSGRVPLSNGSILRIREGQDGDCITILFYNKQDQESWEKIPVGKTPITIGRSSKNDITLKNASVSRRHAMIQEKNDVCTIYNLSRTNGILINGRSVMNSAVLKAQDVIQILEYQMIFSGNLLFYKTQAKGVTLETANLHKVVGKQKKDDPEPRKCTDRKQRICGYCRRFRSREDYTYECHERV